MNIDLFKLLYWVLQAQKRDCIIFFYPYLWNFLLFPNTFHMLTIFLFSLHVNQAVNQGIQKRTWRNVFIRCAFTNARQGLGGDKKRQQALGSHRPQESKATLNCSFSPLRNVTLSQWLWNFQINTSEVICRVRTLAELPPTSKWILPETTVLSLFFRLITFLCHPVSAYKSLPFCTAPLGTSLLTRWDAAWFMNHSIKSIRSSNLLSSIFVLFFGGGDGREGDRATWFVGS